MSSISLINLSFHHKISKKTCYNLVTGFGSDQILDLFLANFCTRKTRILTSDPTFAFFEERCKLYGVKMIKVQFSEGMTLDVDQFLSKSKNADLIYIDSPNNPTGFQFSKANIQKIIKKFNGPIIIDEAYGEFSDYSVVNLVKNNDNLIVIRTFSKAFGLAGLRLGYFVANKRFTDIFSRVIQYPYPLNSLAIEAGILALQKSNQLSPIFSLIKKEIVIDEEKVKPFVKKLDQNIEILFKFTNWIKEKMEKLKYRVSPGISADPCQDFTGIIFNFME